MLDEDVTISQSSSFSPVEEVEELEEGDDQLQGSGYGSGQSKGRLRRSNSVISQLTAASNHEFRYSHGKQEEEHIIYNTALQRICAQVLFSKPYEVVGGGVILFNFFLICVDIDILASEESVPQYITYSMNACFLFYCAEFLVRVYVERAKVLNNKWNRLDFGICMLGLFEVVASQLDLNVGNVGIIRVFRLFRLLRLLRAMRLMASLKELRKLLLMMGSGLKTLFWSFVVCLLVMTVISTAAVTFIHPVVQELSGKGWWSDCATCHGAFSSVMRSNLTFFQTIIAGDSWGLIAVPVIITQPWTVVIFVGSQLVLVFGVLNLIVAVLVDTFAEQRSKDVDARAQDMEYEEIAERKALGKMFDEVDVDHNGGLTVEELEIGADRVPGFRHRLRVLDISKDDLAQLFTMLDEDESGMVERQEFVDALYRINNTEAKTATIFVKQYVRSLAQQTAILAEQMEHVEERLQLLGEDLAKLAALGNKQEARMRKKRRMLTLESRSTREGSSRGATTQDIRRDLFAAMRSSMEDCLDMTLAMAMDKMENLVLQLRSPVSPRRSAGRASSSERSDMDSSQMESEFFSDFAAGDDDNDNDDDDAAKLSPTSKYLLPQKGGAGTVHVEGLRTFSIVPSGRDNDMLHSL